MNDRDEAWLNALAGYTTAEEIMRLREVLDKEGPEGVIKDLMKEFQQRDWRWREEIEKHIPQISVMSFLGPESTIRWLMKQVELKPNVAALANEIKEIQASGKSDDEKAKGRIEAIFPKLKAKQ